MAAMSLVTTIQSEIEKAQLNLKDVDENLKKLTGRDFSEPGLRPEQRRVRSVGSRDEEPPAKRRPQGVFARLGGVVLEQHYQESRGRGRGFRRNSDGIEPRGDGRGDLRAEIHGGETRGRRVQEVVEEEEKIPKPTLASSVARPQVDFKSRTEAAAELTKDRASRDRNRRMFGALIGTLKRFKNDEAKQKDKEEQRAAIDRKLEEKGRAEKEELRRERLELFNQRKAKQAQIRQLTYKMERVKEHEAWEAHMMMLTKFIRTKSSPRLFWLPKSHTSKSSSLVRLTRETIMRELEQDRQQLKDDIEGILGSRGDDDQEGRGDEDEEEEEEEEFMSRGVRSEVVRQGEGGSNDPLDSCADMLDYEAEEGELVFDEADLSGKDNNDTERVVVQVDGRLDGGRKVEIVGSQTVDKSKVMGGNDSEKENQSRHRDKDKGGKDREKERSSDKDRDRERGSRKHRDKGREKERALDRDREKDREKEKNSDRERSRDRHSGRDRDRDKKKDRSRDNKHRESEKKKPKPAAMEVDEPHLPDLEATIVHIKIEKEEDDFAGKDSEVPLKSVKQEKEKASKGNSTAVQDDKTTNAGGDTQPDGELPPSPTIADFPLPSDSPSPPRASTKSPPAAIPAASIPLIPSPKEPALPSLPPVPPSSSPPIPKSPPLPPEPSSSTSPSHTPTVAASEEQQTAGSSSRDTGDALDTETKKKEDTPLINMNINPGDIQLPESTTAKPVTPSDSKKSSKQKPTKEDKKVSGKKDDRKKREKKKSSSKHSGSSDNSSSDDSSSSSSDSSDSDSTDSGSSSSSSDSSSGSSSDSESDSSTSSSSDSDSERKKKSKQKRKKRRGSRSDSASSSGSDSESGDKLKKKKKFSEGKQAGSKKKDEKVKVKSEPLSDEDKSKKSRNDGKDKSNSESKDRNRGKSREKESGYKSKDKDRDRDVSKRQERDRDRGKASAGRSKSREKKRDRSKSRDRSSRRDRSRSRDTSRKDRKDRR